MNSNKNATLTHSKKFSSYTIQGLAIGRTIGFPTINLSIPKHFPYQHGVYSVFLIINKIHLKGIFYFGPRYLEDNMGITLEAHILFKDKKDENALKQITPKTKISFTIKDFIRPPRKISSKQELKKFITKDIHILTNIPVDNK